MSDDRRLQSEIDSLFDELAPTSPPDHLLPGVLSGARRRRQWPRWYAFLREPTMHTDSRLAVGSPTVRAMALVAAAALLVVLIATAGVAGSRLLAADGSLIVDASGGGTHDTIAAAVADAGDGDEILVRPGTYDESVTITHDITIQGDGDREDIVIEHSVEIAPFATGSDEGLPFAFLLEDTDATIAGLTLRGEASRVVIRGGAPTLADLHLDGIGRVYRVDTGATSVPTGVEFNDATAATLIDSDIDDADIDIEHGSTPTIRGNTFRIGAIWIDGPSTDPLIEANVLESESKWGIAVFPGAGATIIDNEIRGPAIGIEFRRGAGDAGTPIVATGNDIIGATTGIDVPDGVDVILQGNTVSDSLQIGIQVVSDLAAVSENKVEGGSIGMFIGGAPTITANEVSGAEALGVGFRRRSSALLRDNSICGNAVDVRIVGDANPDIDDSNTICVIDEAD